MEEDGATTQSRIHKLIFEPANQLYYGGSVRSTGGDFELPATYEPEVRQLRGMKNNEPLGEKQLRMMDCVIPGANHARTSQVTGSSANMKYLSYGMSLIQGPLHRIWGEAMNAKVAVIVPYVRQKEIYEAKLLDLRDDKAGLLQRCRKS